MTMPHVQVDSMRHANDLQFVFHLKKLLHKFKTFSGPTAPLQDAKLLDTTTKSPVDGYLEERADSTAIQSVELSRQEPVLFECRTCGKKYKRRLHFLRHEKLHLQSPNLTKCSNCNKTLMSIGKLKRHKRKHHTGDKVPYACNICNREFTGKPMLQFHLQIHCEEYKPYECQERSCNKRFGTPRQLEQHKRTHSDHRPHHCTQCNSRFKYSNDLLRHSRTHTGEKPHVCAYCGRRFAQTTSLNQHERTHTGERPYFCQVCGSTYTQSGTLRYHIASSHPEYVKKAEVTSVGVVKESFGVESSDEEDVHTVTAQEIDIV
ncbi:uncharacterized protein [Amphiura filiformis]|uniref:uncharacterized protein n=1 Tax=Amphiura filiformis TaxID=82378 RepID=UPI003B2115DC